MIVTVSPVAVTSPAELRSVETSIAPAIDCSSVADPEARRSAASPSEPTMLSGPSDRIRPVAEKTLPAPMLTVPSPWSGCVAVIAISRDALIWIRPFTARGAPAIVAKMPPEPSELPPVLNSMRSPAMSSADAASSGVTVKVRSPGSPLP